jgi:hypothetical protein
MNNAFWVVIGQTQKSKDGRLVGGPKKKREGAHFRQRGSQTISMPMGFPAAHLSVRSPKLCFVDIMFVVRKAGGECKQLY